MAIAKKADDAQPSNMKAIKDFFQMSAREAMAAANTLSDEDKKQLGDGIRNGSLTY